ncbi:TIGR03086 family metal-binding protein [Streptomyces sp. Ncost-T10-10d]|uniref:TIGR03086 family metal-binding protein n=1 Tax=Streptomyces sp. Ncost-T10-10d TaxID=1839774 RepID=UPI00081DD4E7|nr:TIGR03086 family metal-binding protein [Streptomyces sp. Ncost-T10-10d]SCF58758.1 TIGR03086 family protein [Streptomyces sp. Ncost-T10-10d]
MTDGGTANIAAVDIRELDRRALATLGAVIAQIGPDHLRLPTPCADWTLHGLLRHQVSENLGFAAAAAGVTGDLLVWDQGDLGGDPYQAYLDSADTMTKAFAEDVLDHSLQIREFGFFPGRVALGMHVLDCVVHGWDIAQTIGVAFDPGADLVHYSLEVAALIPTGAPSGDRPRAAFAPAVEISASSPDLERLLGLVGRRPTAG